MATLGVRQYRWDDMPHEAVTATITRKVISGEREMLATVYLKGGAVVPTHEHESEQVSYVLKGALRFDINGSAFVVRAGEVLCIPSRVAHGAEALEDTVELDVFSPIRQDWIDKTDDYFRRDDRGGAERER
ncbi:MAG: cupin domain-containing protein [Acidobacteriota bacterium]